MSDVTDAVSMCDEYTQSCVTNLTKTLDSTEARQPSTSIGQVDANAKSNYVTPAQDDLANTPLSNVNPDLLNSSVDTVGTQMQNDSTSRISQTPNNTTTSSFSSLGLTDPITGSNTSNTTLSGSGVGGPTNPLIGGNISGAFNTVASGVTATIQQQALAKVETTLDSVVGFNIRQVANDVQNAAISMVATAITAKSDIALQIVYINANNILTELNKKDAIVQQLITEITALNNLVAHVLGSQPSFQDYLTKLIQAYGMITAADNNLKLVVASLKTTNQYNATLVTTSINSLTAAKALILPTGVGPPVRINEVLSSVLTRSTSADGLAAVLATPGVIFQIAQLMLQYSKEILIINGLISTFLSAISNLVNSYTASGSSINQATINHLNAGITQLDALLADMKVQLFPTDGRNKQNTYLVQTTGAAAGWGVRLTTIIQFLQTNPGVGSKIQNSTAQNITTYNSAVAALKRLNNRVLGLSTLKVSSAQEDVADTATQVGKLMLIAATAAAPVLSKENIGASFTQVLSLMQNTLNLSGDIRRALQPFAAAQSALGGAIATITNALGKVFSDLGMDRAASLFKKADFGNLFTMTPSTSTFAGAASEGIGVLMGVISSSSSATDQDYSKLSAMKDNFDRTADVNMSESVRSYGSQEALFTAQTDQSINSQEALSASIHAIANRFDTTTASADPVAITNTYTDQSIGNSFNFESA